VKKRKNGTRGIFCLEGDWWGDLSQPSTVKSLLELLSNLYPHPPHIYRSIGTRAEFEYSLSKWTQRRYAGYPILYIAFHGESNAIFVGDRRSAGGVVTLDEIAERLEGRCRNAIIHFAACSTLKCDKRHLDRFLAKTGAVAVSGYKREVMWVESTAFELLVLNAMLWPSMTVHGAGKMYREIMRMAHGLARDLQFRMVVRKPAKVSVRK
jgi:hypothetical protein